MYNDFYFLMLSSEDLIQGILPRDERHMGCNSRFPNATTMKIKDQPSMSDRQWKVIIKEVQIRGVDQWDQ